MKSASTPGQVGEDGTKAKERGSSSRVANGRISRAARSMTSSARRPSSGGSSTSRSARAVRKSPSHASVSGRFSKRSTSSSAAWRASSSMRSGAIRSPSGGMPSDARPLFLSGSSLSTFRTFSSTGTELYSAPARTPNQANPNKTNVKTTRNPDTCVARLPDGSVQVTAEDRQIVVATARSRRR